MPEYTLLVCVALPAVVLLELVVLRASEVDADRPPPIRALNMVGNDSEECPDGTGHHVERAFVKEC